MHAPMPVLALVAAYLIGGIPFGYLVVKWKTGADVRSSGSGNIGATNVLRTTGRFAGVVTLLLDIEIGTAPPGLVGMPHQQRPQDIGSAGDLVGHDTDVRL